MIDAQRMSDELEIAALLNRYARAVDTKDWTLYRSVFTEDANIDYSSAGLAVGTVDEVMESLRQYQLGISVSMHYVTNVESEVDGEAAEVKVMWHTAVRRDLASDVSFFGGRWYHQLVRNSGQWASRNLRLEVVW